MNKSFEKPTVFVPKYGPNTELDRLVSLFHQDFELLKWDPDEMALGFFRTLSNEEKVSLKKDLQELLGSIHGQNQKEIRDTWHRLGADWYGKDFDLTKHIRIWIENLK